jgi:hypothetical protein
VLLFAGYSILNTSKKTTEIKQQAEKAFVVGYKIFDVIFREHYYNGECWSFTNDELEEWYNMEGHYKTSQYAYLTGMIDDKHKHWEDQWAKCK